jgi:hypothetical protein
MIRCLLDECFNSPKHHSGKGKKFNFHGRFKTKVDAKKKEKEIEDSFILKRNTGFYVVTER